MELHSQEEEQICASSTGMSSPFDTRFGVVWHWGADLLGESVTENKTQNKTQNTNEFDCNLIDLKANAI